MWIRHPQGQMLLKCLSYPSSTFSLQLKLKIRAPQIFHKLPSVSWINTKGEVMRKEEMFIRESGCPSGSWKVSLICLQHHTPLPPPPPSPLPVSQSPATCFTYLNAGSNPRQLSSEDKKAEEIRWSSPIRQTPGWPLITSYKSQFEQASSLFLQPVLYSVLIVL